MISLSLFGCLRILCATTGAVCVGNKSVLFRIRKHSPPPPAVSPLSPLPTVPDLSWAHNFHTHLSIEQMFLYRSEGTKRWADTKSRKLKFRAIIWVFMLCRRFGRYKHFRVIFCLNLKEIPEDVGKLVKIKEGTVYPMTEHEGPEGLEV